jgi:GNAT superfamily N-acetyltransferase
MATVGDVMLRRADPSDAPAITALVRAAYAPYVADIGREPRPMTADHARAIADHEVWVLEEHGAVIGVLELIDRDDHLWVENVAVARERHGQGLGRRLLDHAEAMARSRGYGEVRLLTNSVMTKNLSIYRARGFVETHREPTGTTSRVHFAKQLSYD